MKRWMLILSAALAAAVLCGCSLQETPQTEIPETAVTTDAPEILRTEAPAEPETTEAVTEATATGETWPETMDLNIMVEGMDEVMPVSLWDRDTYVIYFPTDAWYLETDLENGYQEDSWENIYNGNVELTVLHLGQDGLEQAEQYLAREEDDYRFSPWDADQRSHGVDEVDWEYMDVRFLEGTRENFLLMAEYDAEAAEGFGTRMQYIMDTFSPKP